MTAHEVSITSACERGSVLFVRDCCRPCFRGRFRIFSSGRLGRYWGGRKSVHLCTVRDGDQYFDVVQCLLQSGTCRYETVILLDLVDTCHPSFRVDDLERVLLWLGERARLDHANHVEPSLSARRFGDTGGGRVTHLMNPINPLANPICLSTVFHSTPPCGFFRPGPSAKRTWEISS